MTTQTLKRTFKDLQQIDFLVGGLYRQYPDIQKTKFGYAYKRFADKNYYPHRDDYNLEISDLRVDNALTDKGTGEILRDMDPNSRGFKFDQKGLKTVMKGEKDLINNWNKKEYDVTPYISSDVPEQLSEEMKDMFDGLFINNVDTKDIKKEPVEKTDAPKTDGIK